MWQVDNRTPFAVDRGWVRDRDGAEVWLVAAKCSFDIRPDGATVVAAEQPPVLHVPLYNGEPGRSSIRFEGDLVLTKKATDVIVVGHAYAPGGRPVTELDIGFRVGPVQKLLRVFGDRRWRVGGASSPEPLVKMPIVYERAFGGSDPGSEHPDRDFFWANPVGTGFARSADHLSNVALPNFEYPDQLIRGRRDAPKPAGFGAIAGHWQSRVRFAGTYDDNWMKRRQPLLPDDFDDRFFQCAPEDQQVPGFLRGGEPAALYRLTPAGDLRFQIPEVRLAFDTRFYDGSRERHENAQLHTVILEPDYPRVSLVWHSALRCHHRVQKLARTIVTVTTATARIPVLTTVGEPA